MSIMQMLLGAVQSGYNLLRSVRFRASASAYLNRTPATATNRKTWTWSGWVKRGALGSNSMVFSAGVSGGQFTGIQFLASNKIEIFDFSGGYVFQVNTTAVYRDPSAWYYVVVAFDTTQATASNRVKLYVNGSQVTALDTASYPSLNADFSVNNTLSHRVANSVFSGSDYFDGYLAKVNFIDGQALTPSSFGAFSPITGVWQPAKYQGTYGTNGFYLPFTSNSTAAALGTDFSGNSNTWTVNNISVTAGVTYDSMTDVPTLTNATTANYAVLNPISNNIAYSITNGNLSISNGGTAKGTKPASFFLTSGKWYWEVVGDGYAGAVCGVNGTAFTGSISSAGSNAIGYWEGGIVYWDGGNSGTGASYTTSDIIGIALDMSAGTVAFYKNNTLQYTATFGSGTVPNLSSGCFPCYSDGASNVSKSADFNFGQRPFAYTPPTGFVALNTFNLAASTIVKGSEQFNIALDTGANIKTASEALYPSNYFEWIKDRVNTNNHQLIDTVRGSTAVLQSNTTAAETTYSAPSGNSVGWVWKAGGAAVTNTAGSISAQVSANPTAGFSVVTYTGTGANATVGHGLGVAPKMVIVKRRDTTGSWVVYHSNLTSAAYYLRLNSTDAQSLVATIWNSTAPTSSVVSIGTDNALNASASTYVAYCFAEIAGFSKFGSYTGNGSTDGTFVYLGFRPEFIMVKRTDTTSQWNIWDTSRNTFNVANSNLWADSSEEEFTSSSYDADFLSNGFKLRNSSAGRNASGGTYIYMAFAENPFKNSLAR
jgi:hypothetical protein